MANLVITLEGFTATEYSIDLGITWLDINTLALIQAGTYTIWIRDAGLNIQVIGSINLTDGTVATIIIQEEIKGKLTEYEQIKGELNICS
jgi:hypothetical protein